MKISNKKANRQDSIDEEMWGNIFLSLKPGPERRNKKRKKTVPENMKENIFTEKICINLPALILFN